jgi:hypothetical protein
MRFFLDGMLPAETREILQSRGHDVVSPSTLRAPRLLDLTIVEIASDEGRVVVTENWRHFTQVRTCPVLFVNKKWWRRSVMAGRLASALDRWSIANPEPGSWAQWLPAEFH